MFTIYALVDPRDYTVRYIGITNDVYKRFSEHLKCQGDNPQKDAWVTELKQAQAMLIMKTLEVVDTFERAIERETYWIHHHLFLGAHLFNQSIPTIRISTASYNAHRRQGGAGRQGANADVRRIILYRHQHGDWPSSVSADMQRWYEKHYFTKPNKRRDGEDYPKLLKSYERGRQWIKEFMSIKPCPPYIKRGRPEVASGGK